MKSFLMVVAPVAGLALAGCGESTTEPAVDAVVAVKFAAQPGTEPGVSGNLVITGFNGTLTLTDIRVVVDDFELKRDNGIAECSQSGSADLCAELEMGPAVVDLPLGAGVVTLGSETVVGAEYEEIEFDVVNFEGSASGLLAQARAIAGYGDWPANASIAATGTFLDAQSGQTRPFTVYLDLDSEVELEFTPDRLDLSNGGSGTITVHVDPAAWLTFQGAVIDLSAYDYSSTGEVSSLEFSFQSGLEVAVSNTILLNQ